MAASERENGYQCQFISEVSDELLCGVCKLVAREPHITSCCGNGFCKACIAQVLDAIKPCPSCSEAEFTTLLNRRDQKKILALQVCCTMKDRGCEWVGKLEDLQAHLLVETNDCQYVDIQCPDKCGESVPRYQLPSHLADSCLNRDYFCKYCNFSDTYRVVCYDHWPKCLHYPVQCPNACSVGSVERGDLEDHIKVCLLQEVSCELSHAGCKETFLREDEDRHMEENTQKHLLLMSTMSQRMCREFEQKLQEQREEKEREIKRTQQALEESEGRITQAKEEFEQKLQEQREEKEREMKRMQQMLVESKQEREKQITQTKEEFEKKLQEQREEKEREIAEVKQVQDDQIRALENKREQEMKALRENSDRAMKALKEEQMEKLRVEVETLTHQLWIQGTLQHVPYQCTPPVCFTVNNFDELETKKTSWTSPDLYTHKGGYKINVLVNSYVNVAVFVKPGEFDDQLKWPVEATITLHLFNQHRNQDHITKTIRTPQWSKPTKSKCIIGWMRVIFSTNLGLSCQKQTQYLKNNCLIFRLTKVDFH